MKASVLKVENVKEISRNDHIDSRVMYWRYVRRFDH